MKNIKAWLKKLGPGFITGAADDDPSGIATYSIAGAQYGYQLNWLSLFLLPLMIAIQEMSARIGMVSGMGLAGVIKKNYPKPLLYFTVFCLCFANLINIGANLSIMAACLSLLLGFPFIFWLVTITFLILILEIFVSYQKYAAVLKWLGLSLMVYVITAFMVNQDWLSVLKYTLIPHIQFNSIYLMTLVGFVGTTISPYLFFWQASEEVEEEIAKNNVSDFYENPHVQPKAISRMRKDTVIGMLYSNFMAAAIVLTTAGTLHASGITNINSPMEAALALKPLAGNFAFLLFTIGIIGIGLQSIPVLAGGIAYSLAETFDLKEGLSKKFNQARPFYLILAMAICIGALFNIAHIDPIKALFYSAVINGIVSVPLIAIIIKMADNPKIVGKYTSQIKFRIAGWCSLFFVSIASVLLIFQLLFS